MAIDIHSQIIDTDELHVPKGFTEASTDQVPSKNSSGELEWINTDSFSGPQGPVGASGSLATIDIADALNPVELNSYSDIDFGLQLIADEHSATGIDMATMYVYNENVTDYGVDEIPPYIMFTSKGGNSRWVAGVGYVAIDGPAHTLTGSRFITENEGHTIGLSDSTGVVTGGVISINVGDNTTFDISAGEGHIVDSHTDPSNPVTSQIVWGAFTGEADSLLLTAPITFIGLERGTYDPITDTYGANIVQQAGPFSTSQLRDIISTSITTHIQNISIENVVMNTRFIASPFNQLNDLATAIGTINIDGNVYSANGVNLKIDKSGGSTFNLGSNYNVSKKDPNIRANPGSTQTVFFGNYQDGVGGFNISINQTDIDANNWDDGSGVLQVVPNNRYSIFRAFYTVSEDTIIHYGQALYTSIANAEAALQTEAFTKNPALGDSPLRSWIIVKGDTVDLTDITRVKFIEGGKFSSVASGATSSTTTLQVAYNNSPPPQIKIDAVSGTLEVQDADVATGLDIIAIKNANGVKDLMAVSNEETKFEHQAYTLSNPLLDVAVVNTDCSLSNVHTVTLAGNRTLALPTNLRDGSTILFIIKQDATGTRTLDTSAFLTVGGEPIVLSTTALAVDILSGISDGTGVYLTIAKDFK